MFLETILLVIFPLPFAKNFVYINSTLAKWCCYHSSCWSAFGSRFRITPNKFAGFYSCIMRHSILCMNLGMLFPLPFCLRHSQYYLCWRFTASPGRIWQEGNIQNDLQVGLFHHFKLRRLAKHSPEFSVKFSDLHS